tara:strand:+ start:553 stop:681 length:129 start_codon:yes stop_codon:yes gene_type:complete
MKIYFFIFFEFWNLAYLLLVARLPPDDLEDEDDLEFEELLDE